MNNTLLRQWQMLKLIPRWPRKISTSELKDKLMGADFSVDLRTIQRDLNQLSEVLLLTSDQAKPQGWSWAEGAPPFDIPGMEVPVALAFHMAKHYLGALLPTNTVSSLEPWFTIAHRVLDEHGNGVSLWPEKIRVLPGGLPRQTPKISPDVQASVYAAVLGEKALEIDYGYTPEDTRHYCVHPIALVVRDHAIYLLCVFDGFGDIRQLVLHRIRNAQKLDRSAERPADFCLDEYIAKGEFGITYSPETLRLEARFAPHLNAYLREAPIAEDQTLRELPDGQGIRLTATVPDTLELRTWLRSFGAHVEVIAPEDLRAEFVEMAQKLARQYR